MEAACGMEASCAFSFVERAIRCLLPEGLRLERESEGLLLLSCDTSSLA
jgi:hypothetical protein